MCEGGPGDVLLGGRGPGLVPLGDLCGRGGSGGIDLCGSSLGSVLLGRTMKRGSLGGGTVRSARQCRTGSLG